MNGFTITEREFTNTTMVFGLRRVAEEHTSLVVGTLQIEVISGFKDGGISESKKNGIIIKNIELQT